MPMNNYKATVLCFFILLLSACAPYGINEKRAGVCNTLNSAMIFSGGTSNTRNADIERAQKPLMQQSYDADCYQKPVVKKK